MLDCTNVIVDLLGRESMPSINMLTFGHSVSRDIVLTLRAIIMSAQSVHLRGGCTLLLKTLDTFESSLQLEGMKMEQMYSIKDLISCTLPTKGGKSDDSLRQVFGMKKNIANALEALLNIQCMCIPLMHALAKDLHSNCLHDIGEILIKYPGTVIDPSKIRADHLKKGLKMAGRKMMLISSSKASLSNYQVENTVTTSDGKYGIDIEDSEDVRKAISKESGPIFNDGKLGSKWGQLKVLNKTKSSSSIAASDHKSLTSEPDEEKFSSNQKPNPKYVERPPRKLQSVTNMIR